MTLGTQSTYGIRVGDQRAGIEVLGAVFGTQSVYRISERDQRTGIENTICVRDKRAGSACGISV